MGINYSINVLEDYINIEEMISCENYLKRVEPNLNSGADEENNKKKIMNSTINTKMKIMIIIIVLIIVKWTIKKLLNIMNINLLKM